jgi:hypothetical protein
MYAASAEQPGRQGGSQAVTQYAFPTMFIEISWLTVERFMEVSAAMKVILRGSILASIICRDYTVEWKLAEYINSRI